MTLQNREITPLRRPKLLLTAARCGLAAFVRERDLGAVLGRSPRMEGTELHALYDREADLDTARRAGDVTYSPRRHVAVLTALLAEMRAVDRPDQV
jgi:hypothetical protein